MALRVLIRKLHTIVFVLILGSCAGTGEKQFKPFERTLKEGKSCRIKGSKITLEDFRTKWTVSWENVGVITLRLQHNEEEEVSCFTFPGNEAEPVLWRNMEILIMNIDDAKKSVTLQISPGE